MTLICLGLPRRLLLSPSPLRTCVPAVNSPQDTVSDPCAFGPAGPSVEDVLALHLCSCFLIPKSSVLGLSLSGRPPFFDPSHSSVLNSPPLSGPLPAPPWAYPYQWAFPTLVFISFVSVSQALD